MTRFAKICIVVLVIALCGAATIVRNRFARKETAIAPSVCYSVVSRQIDAFRSDDFASAYQQASTGFQERFNIETFSDLVRTEYPGLLRANRVEFEPVRFDGQHAVVPAYFFLPDGDVIPCVYSLVNEENGWKIDGARVLRRWPAGRRLGGIRS